MFLHPAGISADFYFFGEGENCIRDILGGRRYRRAAKLIVLLSRDYALGVLLMTRNDLASKRLVKAFKIVVPKTVPALVAVDGESIQRVLSWEELYDSSLLSTDFFRISPHADF